MFPVTAYTRTRLPLLPLATLLIYAFTAALPTSANAQFFFGWQDPPRYQRAKKPPRAKPANRAKRVLRAAREKAARETKHVKSLRETEGPLVLVVSLGKQRVEVFDNKGQVASAPISSGARGRATPTGIFSVVDKRRIHFSNLYDSAPMPFMQRLTWSGIALHAGHLPGYPASHGCIRMPYGFAQRLFKLTEKGARVIVSHGNPEPVAFHHPDLFRPLPPGTPLDTAANGSDGTDGGAVTTVSLPLSGAKAHAGASDAAMMLGITPAVAEAGLEFPRTRTGFAAAREAGKRQLAETLKAAEAARDDAKARLAEAAKAAKDASAATREPAAALEDAQQAHRRALLAVRDAEEKLARTIARLIAPRALAKADDAELQKAAATETSLEDDVFRLLAEADARKSEIEPAQKRLDEVMEVAEAAEAERSRIAGEIEAAQDTIKSTKEQIDAERHVDRRISKPVSVFISRKTSKIYVRQSWEPLLELPVTIENPDQPLGTYVFTATDWADNETEMRWSVVTLPPPAPGNAARKTKSKKKDAVQSVPAPVPAVRISAKTALDRITIPDEARERIAELLKPGSSLIISDNALSLETGRYTDFIVSSK